MQKGKQLGMYCVRGKIPHDLCRTCSMEPLHPCGFPPNILEGMRQENDQYEGTEFTPSTLLECDRRTVLYTTRDHWVNPEHAWYLMRGHMVHHYMEQLAYPDSSVSCLVREKRLSSVVETMYGTKILSGKMDLVVVKSLTSEPVAVGSGTELKYTARCKIVDYKTKKIDHSLTEPDPKHEMQLNIYAWLVENALLDLDIPQLKGVDRVVVDELELVYIDMMKVRRFSSLGHIEAKGVKHRGSQEHEMLDLQPIAHGGMEDIEAWIIQRVEEKIKAKEVLPPRLEGDEAKLCTYCSMREHCFSLPN